MIAEITNRYERFSDSIILDFFYQGQSPYLDEDNYRTVKVTIRCMNRLEDYEWEIIRLTFIDVISFRFIESEKSQSTIVDSVLIKEENNVIIFDFFPTHYGDSQLVENPDSDFYIRCRKIEYEILQKE